MSKIIKKTGSIGIRGLCAALFATSAAVFLAGCESLTPLEKEQDVKATTPVAERGEAITINDSDFIEAWAERAKEAYPKSAVAIPRTVSMRPDAADGATALQLEPKRELPSDKIDTIDLKTFADFITTMSGYTQSYGINILSSEDANSRSVNVYLQNVAWDQAFTSVLRSVGLTYIWEGDIIQVMTLEELRGSFEIDEMERRMVALKEEIRSYQPLLTQTIPVHFMNAEELQPHLQNILLSGEAGRSVADLGSASRRGSVTVNKSNNRLVIHATYDDLVKMINLVEQLDRPTAQVLIEAKIVVASKSTARELGVQWGGLYSNRYANGTYWVTPGYGAPISFDPSRFGGDPDDGGSFSGTGSPFIGPRGLRLGLELVGRGGDSVLNNQLTALETAGKLNILANPSITTLDNRQARLKSGFQIPYRSESEDGGTTTEFVDAVLELRVTPQVVNNQMVRLEVYASNDEPDYTRVDAGITAEPAISTRTAETNLLLFDGETTVIGGLTRTYGSQTVNGVPFLKDIPGIGALFRTTGFEERHENLLIFITPYIIKPVE